MAQIEQAFGYEQSAVPLQDGSFFQPLRDAIDRWSVGSESMYAAAPGKTFRVLYELAGPTFILIEYGLCEAYQDRSGRVMWRAQSPPRAGRLASEYALNFILKHQFPIPDSLQPLLSQPAKRRECRPLEYWLTLPLLDRELPLIAQDLELLERAQLVYDLLVDFVQALRAWDPLRPMTGSSAKSVAIVLFGTYPVDSKRWWGSQIVIPPAMVAIEDLPWPESLDLVRVCLLKIKVLLRLPLSAHQATWFFGTHWYPTADEQEAAAHALQGTLPQLEPLVVELGTLIATVHAEPTTSGAEEGLQSEQDSAAGEERSERGAGPSDRQALASYERAVQLMGVAADDVTDRQVYDWIAEHGLGGEFERYELPDFHNWRRYRNRARKARDTGNVPPDTPTKPRSAVRRDEL